MVLALGKLRQADTIKSIPVNDYLAATSVGVVGGTPMLDLAYEEDSRAEVDMNVVQTGGGLFIEVQGTAETQPFDRAALDALLGAGRTRHQAAGRAPARHRRRDSRTMTTSRAGDDQPEQGA